VLFTVATLSGLEGIKKFVAPTVRIIKQLVVNKPVLENKYHNYF